MRLESRLQRRLLLSSLTQYQFGIRSNNVVVYTREQTLASSACNTIIKALFSNVSKIRTEQKPKETLFSATQTGGNSSDSKFVKSQLLKDKMNKNARVKRKRIPSPFNPNMTAETLEKDEKFPNAEYRSFLSKFELDSTELFSSEPLIFFEANVEKLILELQKSSEWQKYDAEFKARSKFCQTVISNYYQHLLHVEKEKDRKKLLEPQVLRMVIRTLLKTRIHTSKLANHLRVLERTIGSQTVNNENNHNILTDAVSYELVIAHGKAGNLGRCLSLLKYRQYRKFPPKLKEFLYSIHSINSAALVLRETSPYERNLQKQDTQKQRIHDTEELVKSPSRWLDAILVNMSQRNFPLDVYLGNKMLSCFASTGRTEHSTYMFFQTRQYYSEEKKKSLVRLHLNKPPSPLKLPSQNFLEKIDNIPKFFLQREENLNKSLREAILFAKSLQNGNVCGHSTALTFNTISYNLLIKCCCHYGAYAHAFDFFAQLKKDAKSSPDHFTYNTLMINLAMIGDIASLEYFLNEMESQYPKIQGNYVTAHAMVQGYLASFDFYNAIQIVKRLYHEYNIIPRSNCHYQLLETMLGGAKSAQDIEDAKQYVLFLQSLWREDEVLKQKLGKQNLINLFRYYGYELNEGDFDE